MPLVSGRGRPALYATPACRAAVYRRRRAGVPEDTPRQPTDRGPRRGLVRAQAGSGPVGTVLGLLVVLGLLWLGDQLLIADMARLPQLLAGGR